MTSKRTLKLSVLIGAVLLFCFSLFTAFTVKADNYNEAQAGVTIHQNYDISTASDGKYADLLLNKDGSLSDYYKNYYAGGTVDFKNGHMYEADKTGVTSTVRLLEKHSGTFSIIGQGFYDEYGVENGTFVADYGRLVFQFTNMQNPKQYLKLSFAQTGSNDILLNVYYFDEDLKQDGAYYATKTAKNMCSSFTGQVAWLSNKNLPFRFEYVMATQTLNMRDKMVTQGATHSLNTLTDATLPVFENYSVDMIFENKSQKNTAKFTVFELCGKIPSEVITDGYDIATANDGKYAKYEIDPSALNEYFTKNYAGNYINFNNGRLYEAGKKNTTSTVELFDEHSGEFSIVGQGFYDEFTASSSAFTGDYGRLAFQLTNVSNGAQYLKFSFTQTSSNYLELNVYYYDKDVNTSYLNKTTIKICASFTGTAVHFNGKNVPFKFSYNVNDGMLSVRDIDGVVSHDLTADMFSGTALPVFENYSVDMLFENKSQTNTAKFIVYELCGDAFAETENVTVTDMSGATVEEIGAVKGAKYVLPANEGKGFVGYEMDGKIYPAGYVLTVDESVTIKQMYITPTMVEGASVRIDVTPNYEGGIRFLVTVDDAAISAFGENATMYGVLIYTNSINGAFDLNEAGSQCKELKNYYEKDGLRGYYITLTNIKEKNYQTSYSARAYVEVTLFDGSTVQVATDYVAEDNARSPYEVAQKAEQDGVTGTMIDAYLGRTPNAQN